MPDLTTPQDAAAPGWSLARFLRLHMSEVWVRFLLAMVGLILAFGAALFSTVSRESGDLWATFILASAALVLAALVGLTTVPYLARRVALARVRDAINYDVTRIGLVYVLITIVIAIAALNTGNNLLYIIVAAMLAAILVSGVASAFVLRELELDVRLPEHVFAKRQLSARIVLRNLRRWLPAFSLTVVPPRREKLRKQWQWEKATFAFPPGRARDQQWFHLPDRALRRIAEAPPKQGIFESSIFFPYLPAGVEVSADLALQFERRGRYQQDSFGIATRFPFSFLTKTRRLPIRREVIVYPPVEPTDEFFQVLPLITGEFETFVRGRGYDLYRIREYMPEDSARHVDWKATAKSGSPKVREFTREDERKLRIIFDNPVPGKVGDVVYENAVAMAASLAWYFTQEDAETSFLTQGFNGAELYGFLAHLAVIQPNTAPSVLDELRVSDDYNVILTTRPHGTIPTALWSCSYFIFVENHT